MSTNEREKNFPGSNSTMSLQMSDHFDVPLIPHLLSQFQPSKV